MIIDEIKNALGLQLAVEIVIKPKLADKAKADGKYWGLYSGEVLEKHLIYIYSNSYRNVIACIAHELIHAWQEENEVYDDREIHGKMFRDWAEYLTDTLNLPNDVYLADTDI